MQTMLMLNFNSTRIWLTHSIELISKNRIIAHTILSKCEKTSLSSIIITRRTLHNTRRTLQTSKSPKNMSMTMNANNLTHNVSTSPKIAEPTFQQLKIVALRSAIPMIGFGFMDNLVMITAGEMIDLSLGVTFGLSTLTAAGFGQCISNVVGFTSGGLVDAFVTKLHISHHGLNPAQLSLKRTRIYHTIGGSVGVLIGCLLGMSSLLFIDTSKADRMRKAKELHSIFQSVMNEGHETVEAEKSILWMYDRDKKEVWSRIYSSNDCKFLETRLPINACVAGTCVESADIINVKEEYNSSQTTICVPVFSKKYKNSDGSAVVLGAIQMTNKKNGGFFTESDTKILKILSSHVAAFIQIVQESEIN